MKALSKSRNGMEWHKKTRYKTHNLEYENYIKIGLNKF